MPTLPLIVRLLDLLMAGLIAGILLGIWLGYNPGKLSASTYVEQQQNTILALNTLMPILGLITIILTGTSAFLQREDRTIFITLLAAAVLLIISGLITRFGNQPINSIVMTWDKALPPADWATFRDQWWSLHQMRALTGLLAFCLIAGSSVSRG